MERQYNYKPFSHILVPNLALVISVLLVVIAGIYLFSVMSTHFKFQALETCNHISKIERTLDNGQTKVTYPDAKLYAQCLQQIGVK